VRAIERRMPDLLSVLSPWVKIKELAGGARGCHRSAPIWGTVRVLAIGCQ
jgi:hypothetical protein